MISSAQTPMNVPDLAAPPPAPAAPPHIPLDDSGRIAADIACRACGYNLRSLAPDTTCPECGMDVSISLAGDLLRYSDPKWVNGLARGMTYLLIAIIVTLAALLVGPIAQVVGIVLALIGASLVTAAEPHPPQFDESRGKLNKTRIVARTGLLGGLIMELGAVAFFFNLVWQPAPAASPRDALVGSVLVLLAIVLFLAGTLALLFHLRRLALRIPDARLAAQTRIVTYGFIAAFGLSILTMIITVAAMISVVAAMSQSSQPSLPVGALMGTVLVTTCLDAVLFLVFGIWALVLANWYRMRFNEAVKQARAIRKA